MCTSVCVRVLSVYEYTCVCCVDVIGSVSVYVLVSSGFVQVCVLCGCVCLREVCVYVCVWVSVCTWWCVYVV